MSDENLNIVSTGELDLFDELSKDVALNHINLSRIFLSILRSFFSNKNHFKAYLKEGYPAFDYTYSDNIINMYTSDTYNDSKQPILSIVGDYQFVNNIGEAELMSQIATTEFPKLVVSVSDIQYKDVDKLSTPNISTYQDFSGGIMHSFASCQVSVSAYATSYEDASILNYLTFNCLSGLKMHLVKLLCIDRYKPAVMSSTKLLQPNTAKKIYNGSCAFTLEWQQTWSYREEAARFREARIVTNEKK